MYYIYLSSQKMNSCGMHLKISYFSFQKIELNALQLPVIFYLLTKAIALYSRDVSKLTRNGPKLKVVNDAERRPLLFKISK